MRYNWSDASGKRAKRAGKAGGDYSRARATVRVDPPLVRKPAAPYADAKPKKHGCVGKDGNVIDPFVDTRERPPTCFLCGKNV